MVLFWDDEQENTFLHLQFIPGKSPSVNALIAFSILLDLYWHLWKIC